VAYADNQTAAQSGFDLAYFDLTSSPPDRCSVDQAGSRLIHRRWESSRMAAVGNSAICWITPFSSANGHNPACFAVGGSFDRAIHFPTQDGGYSGDGLPYELPASRPESLELFTIAGNLITGEEPMLLRVVPPTPTPSPVRERT